MLEDYSQSDELYGQTLAREIAAFITDLVVAENLGEVPRIDWEIVQPIENSHIRIFLTGELSILIKYVANRGNGKADERTILEARRVQILNLELKLNEH